MLLIPKNTIVFINFFEILILDVFIIMQLIEIGRLIIMQCKIYWKVHYNANEIGRFIIVNRWQSSDKFYSLTE